MAHMENRTKKISIRFTPAEYERLTIHALSSGLSESTWARLAIIAEMDHTEKAINKGMKKIGARSFFDLR